MILEHIPELLRGDELGLTLLADAVSSYLLSY